MHNFRMRLSSKLVSNISEFNFELIKGSFDLEEDALKFAHSIKDGRNFVLVFGRDGKPVHIIGYQA